MKWLQKGKTMLKKLKDFSDRVYHRNPLFWHVILLNVILLVAMVLLFYPQFQNEADLVMQTLLYGVGQQGVCISHIMFSNIVLGKLMQILLGIAPGIAWYVVLHYIAVFVSLVIMGYVIIKRNPSKMGWLIAIIMGSFFGYEGYVTPGYLKTAAFLCAAAFFLWIYFIDIQNKRRGSMLAILALMTVSSMVSVKAFTVSFVLWGILLVLYLLLQHRLRENIIRVGIITAEILLLVVAMFYVDEASYTSSEHWQPLAEVRDDYEKIYSFGVASYDEDNVQELNELCDYVKGGWEDPLMIASEAEYYWLSKGIFLHPNEKTEQVVHYMVQQRQAASVTSLNKYLKTVPIGFFQIGMFYLFVTLLILRWLYQAKGRGLLTGIALAVLLAGCYPLYLHYALSYGWVYVLVMLPVCGFLLLSFQQAQCSELRTVVVYLLVLSVMLYTKFSGMMVHSVREEDMGGAYEAVVFEPAAFVDLNEYVKYFSIFEPYRKNQLRFENVYPVNGIYSYVYSFGYNQRQMFFDKTLPYSWVWNSRGIYIHDVINFAERS